LVLAAAGRTASRVFRLGSDSLPAGAAARAGVLAEEWAAAAARAGVLAGGFRGFQDRDRVLNNS